MREAGELVGHGLVALDSSANVRYVTHLALIRVSLARAGLEKIAYMKEGRAISEYLSADLRAGNVRMPSVVLFETLRVVRSKVREWRRYGKLGPFQIHAVKKSFRRALAEEKPLLCDDDESLLGRVEAMYGDIFGDPGYGGLRGAWDEASGGRKPPPGRNDRVVPSTAAGLARGPPVRLLSADMDFSSFAGEIRRRFGVVVAGPWRGVMRRGPRRGAGLAARRRYPSLPP